MKLSEKLGRLRVPAPTPVGREPGHEEDPRDTRLAAIDGLRTQLAMLQRRERAQLPRPPDAQGTERARVAAPMRSFADALLDEHDRAPRPLAACVPGECVETPRGRLYRTVVLHDVEHRHGGVEVLRAAQVRASEVAALALDSSMAELDFARALYIDTETTGLAGGSGTLPFLIGMAWFEGAQLCVEQLLLPRPGHETPMLARLAERMAQASTIVSYNGKSFDWPLLRTRFVLNRMAPPPLPAHLDLLHCARRVYKPRLGSVRLVFLEQELLGYERIDDLPGELIPQRYFEFLRGHADGGTLKPILDHNRSDLVALPALLGELVRRFALEPGARQHARDQLGFARVAARACERERAIALARAALETDVRGELNGQVHFLLGELELARGAFEAASAAFERAVEAGGSEYDVARAHLALAKLHEHKTKACARALTHAAHTGPCEGASASERRVARLSARLARANAAT